MHAASGTGQGQFSVVPLIILALLVAAVVLAIRFLKPRLRESRHRAWEKAGLLPEQLEADDAHRRDEDDRDVR